MALVESRDTEIVVRVIGGSAGRSFIRLSWRTMPDGEWSYGVAHGVSDQAELTIPGLQPGTEYEVMAAYMNRDGFDLYLAGGQGAAQTLIPVDRPEDRWRVNLSGGGVGRSQSITVTAGANDPPRFPATESGLRSIAENIASVVDIGAPVAAEDPKGDTLTYSLGGTDAASFDIETSSGQLQTKASLDFETKSSYSVTVSVQDGKDAEGNTEATPSIDDSITVTITVTDVDEPPPAPAAPTVGTASGEGSTDAAPPANSAPTAMDDSVTTNEDTSVEINVIANDTDADSGDSLSVTAVTAPTNGTAAIKSGSTTHVVYTPNADFNGADSFDYTVSDGTDTDTGTVSVAVSAVEDAPDFAGETADRSVAENTPSGEDIGLVASATDADGDILTYSLTGTDAASFDIETTSGQLRTKASLDFETKSSYSVTVNVLDGKDADGNTKATPATDDSIDMSITVTDVDEPPPPPAAPTVGTASSNGDTSLEVTWTAPSTSAIPAITGYDLRYILASADDSDDSNWTELSLVWTSGDWSTRSPD